MACSTELELCDSNSHSEGRYCLNISFNHKETSCLESFKFRYLILVVKVATKAEWTEWNFVDSGALELLELGLLGVRPFSARNFKGSEVQSSLKSGSGICFTCLCLVHPCTPSIQSFKFTKGIVLHSPPSYIGLSGAINYI